MLQLPPGSFRRVDEAPDAGFYRDPRLVTHIDDAAIGAVTRLYREQLPAQGSILDLMSSWVSHLPPEVTYRRVTGLGMNETELRANPRLDEYVVQDLNREPNLPFDDAVFDGAVICVSIQYLTRPEAVLREVGRVLRPDAPLIITFSNRCFPTKAVAIWQALDDAGHARLVTGYLQRSLDGARRDPPSGPARGTHLAVGRESAGGWTAIETLDRTPAGAGADPLYAVIARRAPN